MSIIDCRFTDGPGVTWSNNALRPEFTIARRDARNVKLGKTAASLLRRRTWTTQRLCGQIPTSVRSVASTSTSDEEPLRSLVRQNRNFVCIAGIVRHSGDIRGPFPLTRWKTLYCIVVHHRRGSPSSHLPSLWPRISVTPPSGRTSSRPE